MLVLTVAIFAFQPQNDRIPQHQKDALTAINAEARGNRERVRRVRLKFTLTTAWAKTMQDARTGNWLGEARGTGAFAFDGRRGVFKLEYDDDTLKQHRRKVGSDRYSTPLAPILAATDGESSLLDEPFIGRDKDGREALRNRPQRLVGSERFSDAVQVPLYLCRRGPLPLMSVYIESVLNDAHGWKLVEADLDAIHEGVPVAHVELAGPEGAKATYWIDLKRGAIPLESRVVWDGGKSVFAERYGDLRQTSAGAWYPHRWVREQNSRRDEFVIVDASFDDEAGEPPTRLEFSGAVPLIDTVNRRVSPPRTSWDIANLPAHEAGAVPFSGGKEESFPAMPTESAPWDIIPIGATLLGICSLIGGAYILSRRLRQRRS